MSDHHLRSSLQLFAEQREQVALGLETDARPVGQADVALDDVSVIRKAAKRAEHVWIGLVAAKAQPRRDVERHLMATVRHDSAVRPAVLLENVERPQIFDETIGER